MACLKCGRETEQMFCEDCRAVMEKYPVRPDAILLLPKARSATAHKNPVRRQAISADAQIAALKHTVRALIIALVVLTLIVLAESAVVFHIVNGRDARPLGQNYSTATKPTDETQNVPRETIEIP